MDMDTDMDIVALELYEEDQMLLSLIEEEELLLKQAMAHLSTLNRVAAFANKIATAIAVGPATRVRLPASPIEHWWRNIQRCGAPPPPPNCDKMI